MEIQKSKRNINTFRLESAQVVVCPLKQQNITMVSYYVLCVCRISIACKAFFQELNFSS